MTIDPDFAKSIRARLLWLLCGLILSYVVTLGVAIYLFDSVGFFNHPWGWPVMGVLMVAAIIHIRFQFRKFDKVVRMAENLPAEAQAAAGPAAPQAPEGTPQPAADAAADAVEAPPPADADEQAGQPGKDTEGG